MTDSLLWPDFVARLGDIAEALSAVFDDTSVSEIFDGENLA